MSMELRQLVHACGSERIRGRLNRPIRGLAYEADRVAPDMAFFAVRQAVRDGHAHVIEAVQRGATAIISERGGFIPPRAANIRVRDSREALARVAAAYYGRPGDRLRILGLSGGNDLAGVAWALQSVLGRVGVRAGLIGSLRHSVGACEFQPRPAGEESLDVQQMLASMARAGDTTCVMELGETAQEHDWTAGLRLATLIDLHGDVLLEYGSGRSGRYPDRPFAHAEAARRVLRVDLRNGPTWRVQLSGTAIADERTVLVDRIEMGLAGSACRLRTAEGFRRLRCPLPGVDNLRRALLATLIAEALGHEGHEVRRATARLDPIPGYLAPVRGGQPFAVLVDGAHEVAALESVLREVRRLRPKRLLILAASEGGTDPLDRVRLGRLVGRLSDYAVISTSNPRQESPAQIAEAVRQAALSARADGVEVELDRARAIEQICRLAQPGEVVLITGKGSRTVEEADHCIAPFDDQAHARRALAALGWAGGSNWASRPRAT